MFDALLDSTHLRALHSMMFRMCARGWLGVGGEDGGNDIRCLMHFIHCVRHPQICCISWIRHPALTITVATLGMTTLFRDKP